MEFRALKYFLLLLLASTMTHAQDSTEKNLKFAGIPIFNYNRTQGAVLGALGSVYYKVNKNDTISPSSNTGIFGAYTSEKSYIALAYQQLYFNEDKWRMQAALGTGNVNFQFYYEDPVVGLGDFVGYSTLLNFAALQVQRKVIWDLYAGLLGQYISTRTTFGFPNSQGEDSVEERHLNNIGYILSNDSRDNVNYPSTGIFANFKNQFYRSWTGSDSNYTRFVAGYNHFFRFDDSAKHVIAARAYFDIATGHVPFEGQAVVGMDDIRGYSQGKYRGNQLYTLQAEYRWMFYKRFGMVAFLGVASAVENFSDIFHSEILPGVGAGIRFRMIKSEKVNIGIDGAVGRDDWSITFRIGEAFAR